VKIHEKQLHSVTVKIHRTGRGTMPSLPPPENENSGSGIYTDNYFSLVFFFFQDKGAWSAIAKPLGISGEVT